MKVECNKDKLKDSISVLEKVTGKKLSLPVLAHILFLASEDQIKLRATNLDIGVEVSFSAKVFQEGVIAIPGSVISNFLSFLPEEKTLTIELIGNNLTITTEHQSTIVKCFPYEDFPSIPQITKGIQLQIPSRILTQGFRTVLFSVAQSDIKPEFSSVYCYTEYGHLVFVATDSARLAEKKIPIKGIEDGISFLLPAKNIIEIIKIIELTKDDINITVTKSQVAFSAPGIYITSRLIDGNFPDYKQIIPKQLTTEAVLLKEDLHNALRLATVFSGKLQQIRIHIIPTEKLFEIEARNDEVGEHSQQIQVSVKGEEVELLFNQRYVSEVIPFIQQESLVFYASGKGRPVMIRGVADQSFTYIVMPMKVSA